MRLGNQQCGHDADTRQHRHGGVTHVPAELFRDLQRPGTAGDECEPEADLVGAQHGPLGLDRRGLDAPGIQSDVLGRRAEGDKERAHRHGAQAGGRIGLG